MGIRSLLRNAFGRSKAAREESNAAESGDRTPEAATIPEAREEAAPEPAAPAVPTARTAPTDAPAASLPAQGAPADRTPGDAPSTGTPHPATVPAPSQEPVSDLVTQAFDTPKPERTEEAEAKPEPEPEAAKPEPVAATEPKTEPAVEPEPEPEPEPVAVTEPAASVSLAKVESQAPGLVSLYKAARVSLEKQGLGTQRAAVYLVLDRSGSMRNYYKDGTVQHLAEQALGLSANLDDDGTVPVVFFSTDVDGTAEIDLADYEGRVEELHAGLGHMGRTNYHWAINAVIEHYEKSGATDPAFVIFQTDGAPTSKPAAEKALCEAAKLPIFWQFVGFGDPDAKGFDFLRKLDDLAVPEKRVVDNAGFFHAGRDPRSLADADVYQQLMVEFPEWLTEARTAGILPS